MRLRPYLSAFVIGLLTWQLATVVVCTAVACLQPQGHHTGVSADHDDTCPHCQTGMCPMHVHHSPRVTPDAATLRDVCPHDPLLGLILLAGFVPSPAMALTAPASGGYPPAPDVNATTLAIAPFVPPPRA